MWDWLVNAFSSLVDGFVGIFELLAYMVSGIADVVLILGKMPAVLVDVTRFLPFTIAGTIMTLFLIVILFKIFGRE